jgi:hypothetical protein
LTNCHYKIRSLAVDSEKPLRASAIVRLLPLT